MDSEFDELAGATGLGVEELRKLVEVKRQKFAGLLDEKSAMFMVARELGAEAAAGSTASISQLKENDSGLEMEVVVKHAFSPKKFEKGGKSGWLMNLIVADQGGETRLTLWHDDVKRFSDEKIERGAALSLRNCYVKLWQGKPQIGLMYGGSFSVIKNSGKLPAVEMRDVKLGALAEDMNNVDVYARVGRMFGRRSFEREGKQGAVMNFEVADESGAVRATAWNELVDAVSGIEYGKLVKVEGAYTKKGMGGIELHLGWQARVIVEPKGAELPQADELFGRAIEKRGIGELSDGFRGETIGSIEQLQYGQLHYLVCPKCGKRVENLGGSYACAACGEVSEPTAKLVLGFVVGSGTESVRCVAFGDEAAKILGVEPSKLMERLSAEGAEAIVDERQDALKGKELRMRGRVKLNERSGELEFVVERVV